MQIDRKPPHEASLRHNGRDQLMQAACREMAYEFHIDLPAGIIRETWTGTLDYAELVESCRAEWKHPDYRPGLFVLSDFRRARARLTADEALQFASWFSNDEAPPRHAIVVRRELGMDLASMFSMIRESHKPETERTRIFFSYTAADLWLTTQDVPTAEPTASVAGAPLRRSLRSG